MVWITGLSGSGKTTVAVELVQGLRFAGVPVIHLDGDEIRRFMVQRKKPEDYSRPARVELGLRYVDLAHFLQQQEVCVVASVVALYGEVHEYRRQKVQDVLDIVLAYPIEELVRRDPKGLYRAHESGEVGDLVGIDYGADWPSTPYATLSGALEDNLAVVSTLVEVVKSYPCRLKK